MEQNYPLVSPPPPVGGQRAAGVTDLLNSAAAGAERDSEQHRLAAVTHVEAGLRVTGGIYPALETPAEAERDLHVVLAALYRHCCPGRGGGDRSEQRSVS